MFGHHSPLIATVAMGLVLAYAFGLIAHRLRISPIAGYLLAGIAIGPFTPGFVADQALANQLAEIGLILLMFAVGLHFSLDELLSVKSIAVPGAIIQIVLVTLLGVGLGWALDWHTGAGLVFGLALSVASTVVLVRALQERRILETERGRVSVGWLIVEDLAMVLALVLLPAILGATAGGSASLMDVIVAVTLTIAQAAAFVAIMLVGGRRAIPWLLHYSAHTGSRELFRLAVYAIALGIAFGASELFGVSFALGAFFAGMVLGKSQLSQRAAEEAMPLRDAFAVLFFVSFGMLFDPRVVLEAPWVLLGTLAIIIAGKFVIVFVIMRAFEFSMEATLTVSAGRTQIGEFSFILAGLGVALGVLPETGRDLIIAGAIISILLNPLAFTVVDRVGRKAMPRILAQGAELPRGVVVHPTTTAAQGDDLQVPSLTTLTGHDVLIGYGRVGSLLGAGLLAAGRRIMVVEDRDDAAAVARSDGAEVVIGNATNADVLRLANLPAAHRLFVTVPESFEAGQIINQARTLNPNLEILARAHSSAAVEHLARLGATTVMGEHEIARRMLEIALTPEPSEVRSTRV